MPPSKRRWTEPGNIATAKRRKQRLMVSFSPASQKCRFISVKNAKDSRLLTLPAEVRVRIWQYVLGHNMIHLELEKYAGADAYWNPKSRPMFKHRLCRSLMQELEAYKLFADNPGIQREAPKATVGDVGLQDPATRHNNCVPTLPGDEPSRRSTRRKTLFLDLSLLFVCRQIYMEAHLYPFSSNNFSPATPNALQMFLNSLHVEQLKALRSLHLPVLIADRFAQPLGDQYRGVTVQHWNDFFTKDTVELIGGLKTLYLEFFLACSLEPYLLNHLLRIPYVQERGYILHGIDNLGRLNLANVHVSVHYPAFYQYPFNLSQGKKGQPVRGTWAVPELDQDKWAEIVRKDLLAEFNEESWQKLEEEKAQIASYREVQFGQLELKRSEQRLDCGPGLREHLGRQDLIPHAEWIRDNFF